MPVAGVVREQGRISTARQAVATMSRVFLKPRAG
jgi:hypothetical protein